MNIIQKVIDFEREVATNDDHGYDQINRWGVNFDCSGLGITAWERAGVLVKTAGATYTGNMKVPFLNCGFIDVTSKINLSTGEGLIAGDQCLRIGYHTATCIGRNADGIMEIVQAQSNEKGTTTGGKTGDQTGKEIFIKPYYNSLPHWDVILRYPSVICAYTEPTVTAKNGVTFRGNDAFWYQWHLNRAGYALVLDGIAGPKTWLAINDAQEKGSIGAGNAGPLTRAIIRKF